MKTFLFALVLTVAMAASVIVIVDRFSERGQPKGDGLQRELLARMTALEERAKALTALPPVSEPRPPRTKIPANSEGNQSEVVSLIVEAEGMILDMEKGIRKDLALMYQKLLERLDELAAGGTQQGPVDPATKQALRQKLSEMGVNVMEEEGMLELVGTVSKTDRPLELLMVGDGGRSYEALLTLTAVPMALKIGLEDLGLVEVGDPDPETGLYGKDASGCYIYVSWEGLKKPRRAEDLILNSRTNDTLTRCKWVFTASRFFTDTRTWQRHFAADLYKNIVGLTWNYSAESILACPLPEAANENIFFPHEITAPKPETKVRVLFRKEPHPEWDKP